MVFSRRCGKLLLRRPESLSTLSILLTESLSVPHKISYLLFVCLDRFCQVELDSIHLLALHFLCLKLVVRQIHQLFSQALYRHVPHLFQTPYRWQKMLPLIFHLPVALHLEPRQLFLQIVDRSWRFVMLRVEFQCLLAFIPNFTLLSLIKLGHVCS